MYGLKPVPFNGMAKPSTQEDAENFDCRCKVPEGG
jgi:hypothetical protein